MIIDREHLQRQTAAALLQVITPNGIQASNWELFKAAIFGRDTLTLVEDVDPWLPEVAELGFSTLIGLVGLEDEEISEEERGRIHHEHRTLWIGNRYAGDGVAKILADLGPRWGGTERELTTYWTVDATPQFLRALCDHCLRYGAQYLDVAHRHRRGGEITGRESAKFGLDWLVGRISASDLGLLEFHRRTPASHHFQVMRDGRVAYLHEDGSPANIQAPIASLEVQGLAYDGLVAGCYFDPENAELYQRLAGELQSQTFALFGGDPDEVEREGLAMFIDRDEDGQWRRGPRKSSNMGELLDSGIFDTLSNEFRRRFVTGIVRQMHGPEFLTPVGIRMVAKSFLHPDEYTNYQGPEAVWPVVTNKYARGLRRQSLAEIASDAEGRLLHGVTVSGAFLEIHYVDRAGVVCYDPKRYIDGRPGGRYLAATNLPEHIQAWTVSAVERILREDPGTRTRVGQEEWQAELSEEITSGVVAPFGVDRELGGELEAAFVRSHEGFNVN